MHGRGYAGLVVTVWVPMGAQVPVLSPNDHPPQGRQEGFRKGRILKHFQVPLNSLSNAKTAKSSLPREGASAHCAPTPHAPCAEADVPITSL